MVVDDKSIKKFLQHESLLENQILQENWSSDTYKF